MSILKVLLMWENWRVKREKLMQSNYQRIKWQSGFVLEGRLGLTIICICICVYLLVQQIQNKFLKNCSRVETLLLTFCLFLSIHAHYLSYFSGERLIRSDERAIESFSCHCCSSRKKIKFKATHTHTHTQPHIKVLLRILGFLFFIFGRKILVFFTVIVKT